MTRIAERLLAVLLLTATSTAVGADARDWLDRMSRALEGMSYEGTFVHVHQGRAETLYVVHRASGAASSERVLSLDGAGREIIRREDEVTCILPDRQIVLVEGREEATPLQSAIPDYAPGLERVYRFSMEGEERVAGRRTHLVDIEPVDAYRYGYRLWLDAETAMPIRSQLQDERGRVVEEILFTSIEFPEEIPEERLRPSIPTEGYTWYRKDDRVRPLETTRWRAMRLPDGFALTSARIKTIAGSQWPVHHLVYSDGLAAVSVFVEHPEASHDAALGLSQMGGANAYSVERDGRLVTAVGEVPPATVETIARSVTPAAGDDAY
jgi:sigma-E factor negative regulatory protein RseB